MKPLMGRYWDDNMVNYLINEVKQCPYVWDPNSPQYTNKMRKQKFWDKTTHKLNELFGRGNPFSNGEPAKKWNNLKSYYKMEHQKAIVAKQSGESPEIVDDVSVWKYGQALEFLSKNSTESVNNAVKNNLGIRKDLFSDDANENDTDNGAANDNAEDTMDSNGSIESSLLLPKYEPLVTQSTQAPSCSFRKKIRLDPLTEMCDSYTKLANAFIKKQTEPNAEFGRFVVGEINSLSKELQIEAKSKIASIIFELQVKQLKNSR